MTFRKTIHHFDYTFTLNCAAEEPAMIVKVEGFEFLMIQLDNKWQIFSTVPLGIQNMEKDLAHEIEMHLQGELII